MRHKRRSPQPAPPGDNRTRWPSLHLLKSILSLPITRNRTPTSCKERSSLWDNLQDDELRAGYIDAFAEYQAYQPIVAAIRFTVNQHALAITIMLNT
jgi:hypothetical protein